MGKELRFIFLPPEEGAFTFTAPWGEAMVVRPGDAILQDPKDEKDVYRVSAGSFACTYEVVSPAGGRVPAEGHSVPGGPKALFQEADRVAPGIGLAQDQLSTVRRVEAHLHPDVEVALIQHQKASSPDDAGGRKHEGGRPLETDFGGRLQEQAPSSHVHILPGRIAKLDRVLQRRIGVGQQFIDDHVGDRHEQPVEGAGGGSVVEERPAQASIRQKTLRPPGHLGPELNAVHNPLAGMPPPPAGFTLDARSMVGR